MELKQKDLVLLSYHFSDLKESKIRPAIVVSNDIFNKKSKDCVMVPLTSIIKENSYSIIINHDDLSTGKLIKTSRVRVDKLFNVEKRLAIKVIGKIKDETFSKLKEAIFKIFKDG